MSYNTMNNRAPSRRNEWKVDQAVLIRARSYPSAEKEYEDALKPSRLPRTHRGWRPYEETVKEALALFDARVAIIKGFNNKELPR
jgi:hypothetical protein